MAQSLTELKLSTGCRSGQAKQIRAIYYSREDRR